MSLLSWFSVCRTLVVGGRWLERHPVVAMVVVVLLPVAIGYWGYVVRSYAAAARSKSEWRRVLSPSLVGLAVSGVAPYPARRLLERVEPAAFGEWLLPHLVRLGLTQSQLARRLGRPVVEIHAVMYGAPVGARLPSAALVDAICDELGLDAAEGRAVFLGGLTDSPARSRATRG